MIQHLACQMDGNRRWAKKNGLAFFEGHRKGAQSVRVVTDFCLEQGIRFLSLYTFSMENFKRSEQEKQFIFDLFVQELNRYQDEVISKGVRVRIIGERTLFPETVIAACNQIEHATAHGEKLTVNLLFGYGARQEITAGVQQIAREILNGSLSPDAITYQVIMDHLWTAHTPDPDIIIRTGARSRLSNFLLLQSSYSEYFFVDCLWPDLSAQLLEAVLDEFGNRQRNFGA
ncbi:MAG TPA: polyprenyl diphosphate synthase [Candidatus Babeliales bacterium]|nr:polyprenyl diphosphate synthase [Candidatus Babeliales bacterium]